MLCVLIRVEDLGFRVMSMHSCPVGKRAHALGGHFGREGAHLARLGSQRDRRRGSCRDLGSSIDARFLGAL